MTHMLRMWAGFDFAVDALDNHTLRCVHRIYLARRYGIPKWIPVAVRILLRLSLDDLTEEDLNHLGYLAFSKLAIGKESIMHIHRQPHFAPYPSDDDAPHCSNPAKCKRAWLRVWVRDISRRIHHPSSHMSVSSILDTLRSIKHLGMHDECKRLIVNQVEEHCPGLAKEDKAIRQMVTLIQEEAFINIITD